MNFFKPFTYYILLVTALCFSVKNADAQNNLNRNISINVKQLKLADLLTEIGKKGNFYFSYSSEMLRTDSLVTLSAENQTVRQLLDRLFGNNVDYKEAPGYIILRPAPNRLVLVPDSTDEPENTFFISGYILDNVTGKKLPDASVFEKHLLVSTLTDQNGFFKIRLKTAGAITLTVSKEYYRDTTVSFLNKVTVYVNPHQYVYSPGMATNKTERNWLGRLFISSRLRIQSLNIGGFIADVPVQASILPGVGSHGLLSGQIVNNFSFNVLGGYNAGVNGFELGGLCNLNKQDVKYVQVAGLFNVVGGNLTGVQVGGLSNVVYKNVDGVQVAGLFNKNDQDARGVLIAGLANITAKTSAGFQLAGLVNKADTFKGAHIAGLGNITTKAANGFELAGLVNKARSLNGVHMALVNIADTLNGCAIDLLSISHNGYHQLVLYTDENLTANLAIKTGNAKFYTKINGGINFTDTARYYAYGITFGHDFNLWKGALLSTELSSQLLSSPKWNNSHQLYRINALVNIPVAPKIAVFFGPSLNLYDQENNNTKDEETAVTKNKLALTGIGPRFKGWIGWSVGVNFF
ncbi:STN and carboxypeptidase regulatory-like domain-containing protein [Mucilaginibacter sp. AW1-3]